MKEGTRERETDGHAHNHTTNTHTHAHQHHQNGTRDEVKRETDRREEERHTREESGG